MGQQSYVVIPQGNGFVTPAGCTCDTQTKQLTYTGTPATFPRMTAQQAAQKGYTVMSKDAIKDALMSQATNSGGVIASAYTATDVPSRGAVAISRAEKPGGIVGAGSTYTIILDNSAPLSVDDYKIFGDAAGTYAIAQGLVAVPGSLLVIGGSAGLLSLSHLTARASFRPFKTSYLQIQALTPGYFGQNPITYFNTTPNPRSGVIQDLLQLSTLPNAMQYNNLLQRFDTPELFDGINGLRIDVPAGEVITITMGIVSESQAHLMNLLGGN